MSQRYKGAGVDLEAGYESVRRIRKHVEKTHNQGVMSEIGSFGGLFDLASYRYKEPVLVSGTDGVGTKLKLAIEYNRHETIGIDLVAMCVNDIIAQGADPLFFLDYLALGHNDPEKTETIVKGITDGCCEAGCALIGGETAEMPSMYGADDYDLAGFAVGCAEKEDLINLHNVEAGDVLLGFNSSGIHSNGYSLINKIIQDEQVDVDREYQGQRILDLLLEPTRIYVASVKELQKHGKIKSMMHITGGGFNENIPRGLPDHLGALITMKWELPLVFSWLGEASNLSFAEMAEVFNAGIGFVAVVSKEHAQHYLQEHDDALIIGEVVNGTGVRFQ